MASTTDTASPHTNISYDSYGIMTSESLPDGSTQSWTTSASELLTTDYAEVGPTDGVYDAVTSYSVTGGTAKKQPIPLTHLPAT